MTRLMFLMFCEDSGLVAPNAFRDYVAHFSAGDLRRGLKDLFVWLDTKDEERDKYAEPWLKKLPYMNGGLFREKTEIPPLSENFRHTLIVEGCQEFDWSGVSPTVFGSIFEGALSHDHRRANGQHFTSPENMFVSSSGFQLRQRFFSHVARKGFRFGKGVPLSLFGFAS